ncbi:MAG: hypothetical protein H5T97_04015 [Firmicutes bacterium]|nr:hypothetical protein [Bacillota bacterium]
MSVRALVFALLTALALAGVAAAEQISINGTVQEPSTAITISPTTWSFTQYTGQTSSQEFTIQNVGNTVVAVNVESMDTSGSPWVPRWPSWSGGTIDAMNVRGQLENAASCSDTDPEAFIELWSALFSSGGTSSAGWLARGFQLGAGQSGGFTLNFTSNKALTTPVAGKTFTATLQITATRV